MKDQSVGRTHIIHLKTVAVEPEIVMNIVPTRSIVGVKRLRPTVICRDDVVMHVRGEWLVGRDAPSELSEVTARVHSKRAQRFAAEARYRVPHSEQALTSLTVGGPRS